MKVVFSCVYLDRMQEVRNGRNLLFLNTFFFHPLNVLGYQAHPVNSSFPILTICSEREDEGDVRENRWTIRKYEGESPKQ